MVVLWVLLVGFQCFPPAGFSFQPLCRQINPRVPVWWHQQAAADWGPFPRMSSRGIRRCGSVPFPAGALDSPSSSSNEIWYLPVFLNTVPQRPNPGLPVFSFVPPNTDLTMELLFPPLWPQTVLLLVCCSPSVYRSSTMVTITISSTSSFRLANLPGIFHTPLSTIEPQKPVRKVVGLYPHHLSFSLLLQILPVSPGNTLHCK